MTNVHEYDASDIPMTALDQYALLHFGTKGMRWGVTRPRDSKTGLVSREPASSDALNAQSHRSRAKTSGVAALSNKEIQEYLTRVNLEGQYGRVTASPSKKVSNFVGGLLTSIGKQQVASTASNATSKAVKSLLSN